MMKELPLILMLPKDTCANAIGLPPANLWIGSQADLVFQVWDGLVGAATWQWQPGRPGTVTRIRET